MKRDIPGLPDPASLQRNGPGTTTIIDADNDTGMMTARAAPTAQKDNHGKKMSDKKAREKKSALYAISEHSLSEFLDNEPDLYSVSDIKVRYK